MVVLYKKRVGIIAGLLFVAVFVFTFQKADLNNTAQTVTLPVSGKVIVLDAGHGKPDEGAQSSSRCYRSKNKFKSCLKSTKLIRAIW